MQWGKWSYNRLADHAAVDSDPDTEEKDAEQQQHLALGQHGLHRPLASRITPLAVAMTAVLFFVLVFVFVPRPWLAADRPSQVRYYGCGNSTQDASAAGCKFDVMSYTWVHPRCFDQELMYDFLGASEWTWYGDEEGTMPLALSDVAQGQREYVYVTWKYYSTHCTYSEFFPLFFSTKKFHICLWYM